MPNFNNLNNEEALKAVLRSDFSYFIQKSFYTITGGETYHHNWHVDVIAEALQQCIDGGIKRLIINVPPRYMKSICASVAFPAWILGNAKIICLSYNQDLADKLGFDTDPIKPGDANSEVQIKKVNDWYSHILLSRLDNKHEGVIIIVMQRIHEEDLTGFLIETDVNKEWHHIKIPAIAEENKEWVFKMVFTIEKKEKLYILQENLLII